MAILGVDQSAHVVSGRLTNGVVVCSRQEIETAHQDRRVPVLAPSRWLRTADPLPHSWDVTSDSIAAWAAGELGAPRLLLVKAAGARGPHLVDRYFQQAIPSAVTHECLGAEDAVQWLDQLARDAAVERTPA
jgi:dihydroneopterin aldolase